MDIPSFDEIFKQIKMNFWLAGIPFESQKINIRFYTLVFSLSVTVGCEVAFIISKISVENLVEVAKLAPCTCIGILAILKIVLIATKRLKIFHLTNCIDQLYKDLVRDDNKRNLVKREFVFLKRLTKYFYVLNAALISVYNFSTLIIMLYMYLKTNNVNFTLPYALLLPFSTDSWSTWFIVCLHSIMDGFICVLYFTAVDSLYFVLTTHIASHFEILSNEIVGLSKHSTDLLNGIVAKHQYIIHLSEDLEDIFTAPNLFNVLLGSLEICALGFTLTMGDWADGPGAVLFLLSVLLQIFLMSFFGEHIITKSGNVGEAAYSCEWYSMDYKSKKTILQLIQRSSRPQKLTAYKFSTIYFKSFIKIISTSWTYFTILQAVYIPPETTNN